MNIELFKRLKKYGDKTVTVNIDGVETTVMIRSPRYTHGWMAFWNDDKNEYKIEIDPEGKMYFGRKKESSYPWITIPVYRNSKIFKKFRNVIIINAVNNAMMKLKLK